MSRPVRSVPVSFFADHGVISCTRKDGHEVHALFFGFSLVCHKDILFTCNTLHRLRLTPSNYYYHSKLGEVSLFDKTKCELQPTARFAPCSLAPCFCPCSNCFRGGLFISHENLDQSPQQSAGHVSSSISPRAVPLLHFEKAGGGCKVQTTCCVTKLPPGRNTHRSPPKLSCKTFSLLLLLLPEPFFVPSSLIAG
ncbi:hypothetical protein BGZ63DRAFT_258001 [Mariannaea sp. PMI_226]|nr:hypothetical protein BGZ63DRAFT_258001 [Mariannaea sp. PMI_226]